MRIGVDLGGTKIEGVVMDARGEIRVRKRQPTPSADGYHAIVDAIVALVRQLEAEAGCHCRVGVGTPGVLSKRTGLVKNSNTVCLIGQPLGRDLEHRLERHIRVENDANCFVLSEAIDGAGRGYAVVFGVIMGTGVGGGIVVDGQLVTGANQIAGEWGHNVLDVDGPPCYCGRRGCVETFISGPGLARDYARHGGEAGVLPPEIVARAERGDAVAQSALERFLDRFGRALAMVINVVDPHAIVLGGGLSNIARLYDTGRESVARNVFSDALSTRLLRNQHGDSSGVRGAAQLWPADAAAP